MMNFNSLFIGQTNTAGEISSSATKLGKSSYLFSDIIKVILEDEADIQLVSNINVTDLSLSNTLNLSTSFQNIPEITKANKPRLTSDFIGLSAEDTVTSTDVVENDAQVENEIDLNQDDLKQLFLSLAGYTPETKAEITTSDTVAIDKLVNTINKMNAGETVSVLVDGLEEQLQAEIKKTDNPLKGFTAKFVVASAELNADNKIQMPGTNNPEIILAETISAKGPAIFKTEKTTSQKQVDKTPDFRVSNETQPVKEINPVVISDKHVDGLNKSENQSTPKHIFSEYPKPTEVKETKPGSVSSSLNNINKIETPLKSETISKNVSTDTIPVEVKSESNSKEIKIDTKNVVKNDSSVTDQTNIKQTNIPEKLSFTETSKAGLNEIKLSSNSFKQDSVNRVHTSDTQKVLRLTINNAEQVNLREVLNSINKGDAKISISNEVLKTSIKEKIITEPKTEGTTKLEQNLVRLNSKVNLDETTVQQPGIKFNNIQSNGKQEIVTVKEDSFAKLSVLNKQVLANKIFNTSDLTQLTQTSDKIKSTIQSNTVDEVNRTDSTLLKSVSNVIVAKNKNVTSKEFLSPEKPVMEISKNNPQVNTEKKVLSEAFGFTKALPIVKNATELRTKIQSFQMETSNIPNKEIVVEDKKLSNVQIPVKEAAEIKQSTKSLLTETKNTPNKDIVVEDKKLSNVQIPVKESTEIKQSTKSLLTETKNIPNKDIVVENKKLSNVQIPVKDSTEIKHPTKNFLTETKNIPGKEIIVEDKKLSNVQIPVKEATEIKQSTKSLLTESKNIPNKEIVVADIKLSNVQVPVKESARAEQNIKDLHVDSENHLNKDLKVDSSLKESFLKNSSDENNNNSSRQNQNNHQTTEAQNFSSVTKDTAQVPVPNNGIVKPVKESVDNSTNEQTSDNKNVELNPKPAVQETNNLSKEKIVTETRNLNETVKTIRSSEIVKELTNFVKHGETQTVTFKVVPENLGRIKVSLDVANHIAKATIEVETETVKQIVQSNIESLKQALSHSGITVDAINVSLAGNQQRHNRSVDSKRKMNDNSDENKIETDNDALLRKNLGYNTYEYLI